MCHMTKLCKFKKKREPMSYWHNASNLKNSIEYSVKWRFSIHSREYVYDSNKNTNRKNFILKALRLKNPSTNTNCQSDNYIQITFYRQVFALWHLCIYLSYNVSINYIISNKNLYPILIKTCQASVSDKAHINSWYSISFNLYHISRYL